MGQGVWCGVGWGLGMCFGCAGQRRTPHTCHRTCTHAFTHRTFARPVAVSSHRLLAAGVAQPLLGQSRSLQHNQHHVARKPAEAPPPRPALRRPRRSLPPPCLARWDQARRLWTFSLSQYEEVLRRLQQEAPCPVHIVPIPAAALERCEEGGGWAGVRVGGGGPVGDPGANGCVLGPSHLVAAPLGCLQQLLCVAVARPPHWLWPAALCRTKAVLCQIRPLAALLCPLHAGSGTCSRPSSRWGRRRWRSGWHASRPTSGTSCTGVWVCGWVGQGSPVGSTATHGCGQRVHCNLWFLRATWVAGKPKGAAHEGWPFLAHCTAAARVAASSPHVACQKGAPAQHAQRMHGVQAGGSLACF